MPGSCVEAVFFAKPVDTGRIAIFLVVKVLYKSTFSVVKLALLKFILKK